MRLVPLEIGYKKSTARPNKSKSQEVSIWPTLDEEKFGVASLSVFRWVKQLFFSREIFAIVDRSLFFFQGMPNELRIYTTIYAGGEELAGAVFGFHVFLMTRDYVYLSGFPTKEKVYLSKSSRNEKLLRRQIEQLPRKTYRHKGKIRHDVFVKDFETIAATYIFLL